MGCIQSNSGGDDNLANKSIDKNMKKNKEKMRRLARVLLLGAGECGKSTIIKQMKIIHGKGFTDEEKATYVPIIFNNILHSCCNLNMAMEQLGIEYGSEENEESSKEIMAIIMQEDPAQVFVQIAKNIATLWKDDGIQICYARRNEFQLNDSTEYYMENIERYLDPNFIPNDQDIIQARVKTTGIIETEFIIKGLSIRMIDVGGQRSERKKWIHCFENVQSILFITALSEYNMVLEEDHETNRMRESLKLFDSIVNNNFFSDTAIIIFFNKKDVFEFKLQDSQFSDYFPEYEGENDYDSVSSFIQLLFRSRNHVQGKRIYIHYTTATNTENIEFVFNSVIDVISNINLKDVGLV